MMKLIYIIIYSIFSSVASAQSVLTSNSYSGLGLVPSANTIKSGEIILGYSKNIPGARNLTGYNYQIGMGLSDEFELVGRLATNDLKCNMYLANTCARDNIRDFSTSFKYSFETDYSKKMGVKFALGATDFGGAAINFRSYYAVASQAMDNFRVNIGYSKSDQNFLKGNFQSIDWLPQKQVVLSLQNANKNLNLTTAIEKNLYNDISVYASINKLIRGDQNKKNFIEIGLKNSMSNNIKSLTEEIKEANTHLQIDQVDLTEELIKAKFNKIRVSNNSVYLLENTNYSWNAIDALGVAAGIISSVNEDREIEVIITKRDAAIVSLQGNSKCIKSWIQKNEYCKDMKIRSGISMDLTEFEKFEYIQNKFKPELAFSPAVISTIGTEYGAFDADIGANISITLPLWHGAYIEKNEIKSLGINTRNFEADNLFFQSRLINLTNRKVFNQIVSVPNYNTISKFSIGQIYNNWNGMQYEQYTHINERDIINIHTGEFENGIYKKNFSLLTYKHKNNKYSDNQIELTYGKFWGGDKGYNIAQKLWFGDRALTIYLRQSKMNNNRPTVSFAGLQFTLPLTTRFNKSQDFLIKGADQWSYSVESKVFAKDNIITGGYGTIPYVGESLSQIMNRDRNSVAYYENNINRIRSAYLEFVK
jgi:hypothetical protein